MRSNNLINSFAKYLCGINKVCMFSLMLTFALGILAMLCLASAVMRDFRCGISVIEAEAVEILLYIFRSVVITEFFLLLFDYAARQG